MAGVGASARGGIPTAGAGADAALAVAGVVRARWRPSCQSFVVPAVPAGSLACLVRGGRASADGPEVPDMDGGICGPGSRPDWRTGACRGGVGGVVRAGRGGGSR